MSSKYTRALTFETICQGLGGKKGQLLLGRDICNAFAAKGGLNPVSCEGFPQTLEDVPREPTTDDFDSVPSVMSDSSQASGAATGIMMLLITLCFALLFAYCCCEPRTEDEKLFDTIGGRPFSRAGYTPARAHAQSV